MLSIVEIDADERIVAVVVFDPDEIDAAFAELDARYLAGEAARALAHMWSVVVQDYVALNRHELPLMTPDVVSVDHRRGRAFAPGDLTAYLDAVMGAHATDLALHRGCASAERHRSRRHPRGARDFARRLRRRVAGDHVLQVDGDLMSRCEMFDEADLDAALARFDELSRPAPRLENAASQVDRRFLAHFAARDWDAMAEILADDLSNRRSPSGGERRSLRRSRRPDREHASDGRAVVNKHDVGPSLRSAGGALPSARIRLSGREQRAEAFHTEVHGVLEIDADERIAAIVVFDLDDFDAAFAELDARYLAGEAAAHATLGRSLQRYTPRSIAHEIPATAPDLSTSTIVHSQRSGPVT